MAYEVQTWQDKNPSFPLSAARMNHIEAGIAAAAAATVNVKEYGAKGDGASDDTTPLQEAFNAGKESAVYFPAAANGYLTKGGLSLPRATSLEGISKWSCIIKTNSTTTFLIKVKEGLVDISELRFEAVNLQTAGGALDFGEATGPCSLHDLTLGSRFFVGLNFAGTGGSSAVNVQRVSFVELGGGVEGVGTAIKVGDGVHLTVGVWIADVWVDGKTTAGVGQAILYNFCDSCTLRNALIQTTTKAINTGTIGKEVTTGLKITDTIVDTCAGPAFDFALARDVQLIGWNAQGAANAVALRAETNGGPATTSVRIMNGIGQINSGEAIVAELGTSYFKIEGNTISANCTGSGESGIHIVQGAHDFEVRSNTVGNVILGTGKQKKGIFVEAGALGGGADKYTIEGNHCPTDATQTVGVDDKGAGTHKEVARNTTF